MFFERIKSYLEQLHVWANPQFDKVFEQRLKAEIAKTELLRISILMWTVGGALLAGILNFVLLMERPVYNELLHTLPLLFAGIFLLLIYEALSGRYVRSMILKRRVIPKGYRVINLLIETSFPSFMLLFFLFTMGQHLLFFASPIVLIYFLFIILSTLHLNFWISVFSGALAAVQYFIVSVIVVKMVPVSERLSPFLSSSTIALARAIIILVCGIAAGFVALEIKRRVVSTYKAMNDRDRIRQVLGQQVSYALVDHIIDEKMEIASKRLFVSVMFLDIRNFTPFAEKSSPEEVMDFQNKIFGGAADIINKYNGIINQFLGDGFMATFGAPISSGNDCDNAVKAAIDVLEYVEKAGQAGTIHPTRLGIGIHCGEAITGNVGTESRKQYSIVGNVVIQAARIEQLNKELGSQFLVSKEVFDRVENPHGEILGQMMLKGESKPLEIVRIF